MCRKGFSCITLCLGVDFRQAEEKEFKVLDTAKGLAESLDFRVELFGRGVGGAVDVVVEDFVVMQMDGVHDGLERV